MSESNLSLPSAEALQGMIGTLMSNPELMKSIVGALGNASNESEENEKEKEEFLTEENDETVTAAVAPTIPPELISKLPALLSLMSGGSSKPKSKSEADREALLCALKPFLSPSRAEAIERIIKISRLGDILTKL